MESTEESETDQPFLVTEMEKALNDKFVGLALLCVGFGVGFVAGRNESEKDSTSESTSYDNCSSGNPPLLIVSLDGFRSEYFNRGLTPHLCSLANSGVRAKFLQSQFPTKTFPNHYSIVTGLYPESHGIVHNSFYDPVLKDSFSIGGHSFRDPKWWNEGEPMWVTASKQGVKTATFFWPGSDVEIRSVRPDYWHLYNRSVPWSDRVNTVLEWLVLPNSKRPSFILMYVEEPDHTGHISGPQSQEVDDALVNVDSSVIGSLVNGLKDRGIYDCVNIIIVSDHGMTELNPNRIVLADECFPPNSTSFRVLGPATLLDAAAGAPCLHCLVKLEDILTENASKCFHKRARFYRKGDLPKRLHYSNNRRISGAVGMAQLGWRILTRNSMSAWKRKERGGHGYDNLEPNMEALFIARGPAFKEGLIAEGFPNIELYNLMADLLGVSPAPNNGSQGSLNHLLKQPHDMSLSDGSYQPCGCSTVSFTAYDNSSVGNGRICPYSAVPPTDLTEIDSLLMMSSTAEKEVQSVHVPWGVPQKQAGGCDRACVLTQSLYVTGYDKDLHIPLWVAYRLDGKNLDSSLTRKNSFRPDPRLSPSDSAQCEDYHYSGLDRGHLAPNGDMSYNYTAMAQTFYLSNVVPQYDQFNGGVWEYTEELTRELAKLYGTIYVISGSIFDVDNDGIEDSVHEPKSWLHNRTGSAAIPTDFFKIIVRCDGGRFNVTHPQTTKGSSWYGCSGRLQMMSFVLPHTNEAIHKGDYSAYILNHVASVRDILLLSGFDFFPNLSPNEKANLQSVVPMSLWSVSY